MKLLRNVSNETKEKNMKKTMKRMASLTLGLCMAFTIVTPVNAAVKRNQSSKKINGYVLTTRMALEEEYTIYVADPANVGHIK